MKVLIVKIGAIGDTVMALSVLEAIDRQAPGSQITWVCGESVAPLVRAFKRIDEILVVDDRKLFRGGALGAFAVLLPLWLKLLASRFDLIVTGHSDPRYGLLSLTAQGKVRRSFGEKRGGPIPGRYHADEYVRLVTGLDGPEAAKGSIPKLWPSLNESQKSQIFSKGTPVVALAPGGAKNTMRDDALRRWPIASYVRLAELLIKDGKTVVLTGSPSDQWVCEFFKGLEIIDMVGKTELMDLVALYGSCQAVVTHDSGPLHLAILSGTSVISLFGPTNPFEKVPADGAVKVLWGGEDLACRPCYDGKDYAKCSDNLCLKNISVEKVYDETVRRLRI